MAKKKRPSTPKSKTPSTGLDQAADSIKLAKLQGEQARKKTIDEEGPIAIEDIDENESSSDGGEEDVPLEDMTHDSQPVKGDGDDVVKETQADVDPPKKTWVNLFGDNRSPSKGMSLSYVNDDEDRKAPVVIAQDETTTLDESWSRSLIGYIAGNFPGRRALLNCCAKWKVKVDYMHHDSGWLIFKFENEEDMAKVLGEGPYFIFNRPLLLRTMPPFFHFGTDELSVVPDWIKIPGLPFELWNAAALARITSKIGKPVRTDERTAKFGAISYARVLVEVDLNMELLSSIPVVLPNGTKYEQKVEYEGLPNFCTFCKVIGHPITHCGWARRNQRETQTRGAETQLPRMAVSDTNDVGRIKENMGQKKGVDDGFTLVTRKRNKGTKKGNKGANQTVNVRGMVPNWVAKDGDKNKGVAHETRSIDVPSTSGTCVAEVLATTLQPILEEVGGMQAKEIDKGKGTLATSYEDQGHKEIGHDEEVEVLPCITIPSEKETNVVANGEGSKAVKGKKTKKKVVGDAPLQPQ